MVNNNSNTEKLSYRILRRIVQISFLLTISFSSIYGQRTETVLVIKNNGDSVNLTTRLRLYQGELVFVNDSKEYIKGKVYGSKRKIPKSELKKIILRQGREYLVLNNNFTRFYIGYFIQQGPREIFKTFNLESKTYSSGYDPGFGTTKSLNKLVTESYYKIENGIIRQTSLSGN